MTLVLQAILAICFVVGLSGCQVFRNMDEMHSATNDMNNKMGDMNKNVEDTKNTSNDMNRKMYRGLHGQREAECSKLRDKALEDMAKSPDMGSKFKFAMKFYSSFEFQHWDNDGQEDTAEKLQELENKAIQEFFESIQKYVTIDWRQRIGETQKNFFALAATLHKNDPDQEAYMKSMGLVQDSMYTIIERALLNFKKNPASHIWEMPESQQWIEKWYSSAIELLQTRLSFLPMQFYAEQTVHHIDGNIDLLETFYSSFKINYFSDGWHYDPYSASTTLGDFEYGNKELAYAARTRYLLIAMGENANLNNGLLHLKIRNIFANIKIPRPPQVDAPPRGASTANISGEQGFAVAQDVLSKKIEQVQYTKKFIRLLLTDVSRFKSVDPSVYYNYSETLPQSVPPQLQ